MHEQPTFEPSNRVTRLRRLGLLLGLMPMAVLMMALSRGRNFDFDIYRNSLIGVLHGGSVYAFTVHNAVSHADVGFIYPPFASLVMLPLAVASHSVGKDGLALVTTLLVLASMFTLIDQLYTKRAGEGKPTIGLLRAPLITTLVAVSFPTVNNMGLGQVSFALWALVLLDVIVLPPRWQGVLVGLAGAIKLEPMILVPYYLVTRQWRPAVNSSAVFILATAFGAALRWSDSLRYWLHPSVITRSLGTLTWADNWSMYAALSRLGITGTPLKLSWIVLSGLALLAALWRARSHFRAGERVEAVVVMGMSATLITVVTWANHLFFLLIAIVLLAWRRPLMGFPLLVLAVPFLPESAVDNAAPVLIIILVIFGLPRGRARPGTPPARGPFSSPRSQ